MSDKRRRRVNSDDSEGSEGEGEGEVKLDKVGSEELDIEKDEGVVRKIFVLFIQPRSSSPGGSHLGKFHHQHESSRPCVRNSTPFLNQKIKRPTPNIFLKRHQNATLNPILYS